MTLMYEDALLRITVPEKGVAEGHVHIEPVSEIKTVDEFSADEMLHFCSAGSYCATVLFEVLGAQGTNIVLNEQPVRIDVIARKQDDGVQLLWTPKQLDPATMTDAESKLKDATFMIGKEKPKASLQTPDSPPPALDSSESLEAHEQAENYLIKHLRRIP